jgi:hypothetical protein
MGASDAGLWQQGICAAHAFQVQELPPANGFLVVVVLHFAILGMIMMFLRSCSRQWAMQNSSYGSEQARPDFSAGLVLMTWDFTWRLLDRFRFGQIILYDNGLSFAEEVDLVGFLTQRWPVRIYQLITADLIEPGFFVGLISEHRFDYFSFEDTDAFIQVAGLTVAHFSTPAGNRQSGKRRQLPGRRVFVPEDPARDDVALQGNLVRGVGPAPLAVHVRREDVQGHDRRLTVASGAEEEVDPGGDALEKPRRSGPGRELHG